MGIIYLVNQTDLLQKVGFKSLGTGKWVRQWVLSLARSILSACVWRERERERDLPLARSILLRRRADIVVVICFVVVARVIFFSSAGGGGIIFGRIFQSMGDNVFELCEVMLKFCSCFETTNACVTCVCVFCKQQSGASMLDYDPRWFWIVNG